MLMPDIYSTAVISLDGIGTLQLPQTYTAFVTPWCSGYRYYTTSINKVWTQVLRSTNPARGVSEIRDGGNIWKWSRLEVRLKG